MNKLFNQLLIFTLLAGSLSSYANPFEKRDTYGKPFFASRSQGQNLARRLAGEVNEIVTCCPGMNGVLSVAGEYTETFNSDALGRYFSFRRPLPELCPCDDRDAAGNQIEQPDTNIMSFRGTSFLTNNPQETPIADVVADNFLLPSTFNGVVELKPKVTNIILDFNWRMNLEGMTQGLYLDVGVPVVWTRWNMGLRENGAAQPGNIVIPNGDEALFSAPAPVDTIINAWRGQTEQTLNFTDGTDTLPIMVEPLLFARINGRQKRRGIADIHVAIGRNFVCTDYSHMAVNLQIIAPVGTKVQGEYMFEPVIGNGHHLGIGGGMSAHTTLIQSNCPDRSMNMWVEGRIYHLFKAKQRRTFDLKRTGDQVCDPTLNSPNLNIGSRYLLLKRFQNGAFANTFTPGPNGTTLNADVTINVMGEFVILFDYQWSNVSFDIGYNLWGRSQESITLTGAIPASTYGVLGRTSIAGDTAIRTNSQAMINGVGYAPFGDGAQSPVFLRTEDLDVKAAQAPAAFTNKIFGHLGYTFEGCYYAVFMGVGGEVEFSGIRNNAFNQWGVWGKVGFAFS